MHRLFTVLLFTAGTVFCLAQEINPDLSTLEKHLLSMPKDSAKVNTLLKLSGLYKTTDAKEAMFIASEALDLAIEIKYDLGLGLAHKLLGQYYSDLLAEYREADNQYKAALDIFRALNQKDEIANVLDNLGSNYFLMGDDTKSIEYHLNALKIAEETKNKRRIATIMSNLGAVYSNKTATTDKAIYYYRQALPLFNELDYTDGIAAASANIGEIYFKKTQYDSALIYLETAAELDKGTPYACFSLDYLGAIYALQDNFDKALAYHNEAVQIAQSQDAKLELSQSLLALANTLRMKGELMQSIDTYREAQKISESIGAKQVVKNSYESLAKAYAELGDFKNAYTYESLLTHIKDTLYNTDEDKKIQQLQFNFELEKKESAIAVQEATIQRQRIVAWAAGITGVMLLIMVGGIFSRYRYVKRTNKIIQTERDKSKELLLNILPEETARELETSGHAKTRYYENVTVLFTDFKGFSTIAGKLRPQELVSELNDYFIAFDEIVERYGLEKIKTIGDAYMCAGGIPTPNETHALNAVEAAMAMQNYMKKKYKELEASGQQGWELRVGIHTGPIVAGVVGKKKYAYDIWGDTVNIASRMESNGETGKVNISSATYERIKDKFECHYRGKISAKNIGEVDMYFIERQIAEPVES